jgi:hypothetical protein
LVKYQCVSNKSINQISQLTAGSIITKATIMDSGTIFLFLDFTGLTLTLGDFIVPRLYLTPNLTFQAALSYFNTSNVSVKLEKSILL